MAWGSLVRCDDSKRNERFRVIKTHTHTHLHNKSGQCAECRHLTFDLRPQLGRLLNGRVDEAHFDVQRGSRHSLCNEVRVIHYEMRFTSFNVQWGTPDNRYFYFKNIGNK